MPTWSTCYESVVIGRVNRRWKNSPYDWDPDFVELTPLDLIEGSTTPAEALLYAYSYLNHHVGGASKAFEMATPGLLPFSECVLVDYGCGPGTALMALAESEFVRTGRPLKVHYLGVETLYSPALAIARDLFACVRDQGLIALDSTVQFQAFGTNFGFPAVVPGIPVFFCLCYVLAHPYYELRAGQPDTTLSLGNELRRCRQYYGRPIYMVYVNATAHPDRPVHAAWRRLTRNLGVPLNIREHAFTFDVYGGDRLTGGSGYVTVADWRAARFRHRATVARKRVTCDFQVFR